MQFCVLSSTPRVVGDNDDELPLVRHPGSDRQSEQPAEPVLARRYHRLLRTFLLSVAKAPRDRQAVEVGAIVTAKAIARVLSGAKPDQDVGRAVSDVRSALATSMCREPMFSSTLGGGGATRKRTDEAFIRTVTLGTEPLQYVLVLHPSDSVDWIECQGDLNEASRHLNDGNVRQARDLAERWRTPLLQSDLDLAFIDTGLPFWTSEDADAVRRARLRVLRLLALTASATDLFTDVLTCVEAVRVEDKGNEVYDEALAEAAVRATFAVERTRERSWQAVNTYFTGPQVELTAVVRRFDKDTQDATDWDEARERWLEEWKIPQLGEMKTAGVEHKAPTLAGAADGKRMLPDVLTPGFSLSALESDLDLKLDPAVGERLERAAEDAVTAVETGDFALQEKVGRDLLEMSEHVPHLRPAGHYFIAEGLRLQADLAAGPDRTTLRTRAIEEYERTRELEPQSVRAVRGLARTYEALGDPEQAATLFQIGYAAGLSQLVEADQSDPKHRLELSHEILRVTRHHVHCLGELRLADPVAFRLLASSDDHLHKLARESHSLHRARLPLFDKYKRWSQIEWFMGLTLLAKAYVSVGDDFRAAQELSFALMQRVRMLDARGSLSPVELSNIRWWLSVATSLRKEPLPGWFLALDRLGLALSDPSAQSVRSALEDVHAVLDPMLPPDL